MVAPSASRNESFQIPAPRRDGTGGLIKRDEFHSMETGEVEECRISDLLMPDNLWNELVERRRGNGRSQAKELMA